MEKLLLVVILSICVTDGFCQKTPETTKKSQEEKKKELKYEVLSFGCIENVCTGKIYVDKNLFNATYMRELGKTLSQEYKDKPAVGLSIFDDKELALLHLQGKRELRSLDDDARGGYIRNKKGEVIKFRPDNSNSDELVSINLQELNSN